MGVISIASMNWREMSHRITAFCTRGVPRRKDARYLITAVIAGALAVAGCSAGSSQSTHSSEQPAKVELTFQMKGESGNTGKPERLTCDPAGAQAGATSQCSALMKLKKDPFAPIDKGVACPMLLRSNRKILVTGTWFGVTVHRLVVDGGCDTNLFDSLDKILH